MTSLIHRLPLLLVLAACCHAATLPMHFDFGAAPGATGYTSVTPETIYTDERGYGLLPGAEVRTISAKNTADPLHANALVSDKPFYFQIALPEGNYNVALLLGSPEATSDTTVKVEDRRLMLETIRTQKDEIVRREFTVNIRQPRIAGATGNRSSVGLKGRENGSRTWDDKLTLEFNGPAPAVAALEITRADNALTVYIAGDSTVTDQGGEPWASWGQMLPRFFAPNTAVANIAQSGLSLASFKAGRRLDKILSTLRPGDYVLIQFGHNDQKEKARGDRVPGAFTTYAQSLRDYVAAIRAKGGQPVLVTPMYRRRFDKAGALQDSLGDYPKAVRAVAEETGVPCIDLHALSAKFFAALGPESSKKAFVHYPANTFPGQDKAIADNTHFSTYGAYELARCIVEGIKLQLPDLAKRLAPDVKPFDPSHPDDPATFSIPLTPVTEKPRIPEGDGRRNTD